MSTFRTRTAALTLVSIALAAGVSACGSDDQALAVGESAINTVPKDTFVKEGNALCAANTAAVGAAFQQMSQPPTPEELDAAFANLVKESYKIEGDLFTLGAPEGQEQEFVDLVVGMHQVTTSVDEQGQEAFFATDDDPFQAMTQTLVDDFGLTSCQPEG